MSIAKEILQATDILVEQLTGLNFAAPVKYIYNPLQYAREPHDLYVSRFGNSRKKYLFMGMNPGPWGMVQTGVPFGEIAMVRDWLGITAAVGKPQHEHPKRRVEGFACGRSEVSGARLWGLFAQAFPQADEFFKDHYVVNYCPLVWMEDSARNRTPDKLPRAEMAPVQAACDAYVARHLHLMQPGVLVGIGAYAEACLQRIAAAGDWQGVIGRILHPSPASPAANRGWAASARQQLQALGLNLP